jgi:hypothetical protein
MAGFVAIPGILWSGFLLFLHNRLKQGECVGSISPVDPSGFNPNPITMDRDTQADIK